MPHMSQFGRVVAAVVACLLSVAAMGDRIPIPDGFPDASNTGIAAAGLTLADLTPSGSLTITTPYTVIENMLITGTINVKADHVTIRNSYIDPGLPPGGSFYGIHASYGYIDTLVENVTVVGGRSKSIYASNTTIRTSNLSGGSDMLHVGSNVIVEDSYLHDPTPTEGSHNDGIQSTGGSNVIIRRNTIQAQYQQQTSAIILQTNFGAIDNVLIEGNFLSGGTYTLYINDKGTGYGKPTNVRVTDNVWELDGWKYGHLSSNSMSNIAFSGNTFHTGEYIPQNPGDDPPPVDTLPQAPATVNSTSAFQSFALDGSGEARGEAFSIDLDVVPHANNMDAVFACVRGEAVGWSDLAAIFRFYTNGRFEVRDGSAYAADADVLYAAGEQYHVRMDVDPATQRYSVYVTPNGGATVLLAEDYAFRSEQSGTDELNGWCLSHVEGSMTVSNVMVSPALAAVLLGDANNDGVVSADDFAAVQANFGNTGAADGLLLGDANDDGVVSADDFATIQSAFGAAQPAASSTTPVPEPATMVVMALGVMGLVRRRGG